MEDKKFKIDHDGYFFIKRAGSWSQQFCPYQEGSIYCGDWCPRFIGDWKYDLICSNPCVSLDPNICIDEREQS